MLKTGKYARIAFLISSFYGTQVLANEQSPVTQSTVLPQVEQVQVNQPDLADQQKLLDEQKLAAEKQAQLEQELSAKIGNLPLQFNAQVAKIYADNNYQPLWTDSQAQQQFLRDYSAMVVSGISKRSAEALEAIDKASAEGGLVYDVLLTDAFLDYLFYAKNVNKFAQKWLYAANAYKASAPTDDDISAWLSAVQNQQHLAFIQQLASKNPLYKQTVNALPALLKGEQAEAKVYKMAINAQRLRILPEFKNGLFVNIPSYQLHYYRDGKLALSSKVIVGKQARKTPVMYSKLSNVVVNPPWNAPVRLINEDIIPKVRKDPSYIYRNGYTIIDGNGRTIDPYTIDWENMTAKKFPYRLRQAPGDSALGNYKFNMPSSDAIYLHDTPSRGLFAKENRALSSGCVRVEKSEQLASILLGEAGWTDERRRSVVSSRKTTSVNVQSNNPVFLYYVTSWVDNGKTHTLPDIYGYDNKGNLSYINWQVVKKYLH